MIHINANVDVHSHPKVRTWEVQKLITHYIDETLYVTFYARKEAFEPQAFRENGDNFLRVILPYDQILQNDDNTTLMLAHLAQSLEQMEWLDHGCLKRRIEKMLERGIKIFSSPGFQVLTPEGEAIKFEYYLKRAPATAEAFDELLPFSRVFYHARVSGQEIWAGDAPILDIIQENASVFAEPGEAVFGPVQPLRNRVGGCMGIFYGEGKGLDAGNIFAKVLDKDLPKLAALGEQIWKEGGRELRFEKL